MITVDLHLDCPWIATKFGQFDLNKGRPESAFSLPRMKEGRLDKAIFALYLPDSFQDKLGERGIRDTVQKQIEWLTPRPDGIYLAIEGARLLGQDYYNLGSFQRMHNVKYITLTHNRSSAIADSATDVPIHGGLATFASYFIQMCCEIGVAIDVSHASDNAAESAINFANGPIIASHSGCRKVLDHVRNLTDHLIQRIAMTGGIVGIPFARKFVGPTAKDFLNHVDHVVQLVGSEVVAVGSDLDGADMIDGVNGVEDWGKIVLDGMSELGYSDETISAIAGGNAIRVLNLA